MATKTFMFGSAMFNWSETQRMVEFATELAGRGHRIVFLGSGKYDWLLQDKPFIIREVLKADEAWYTPERIEKMLAMDKVGNHYATAEEIEQVVSEELALIEKYKPSAVVTGYRTTLTVSARIAGVTCAWCLSAVLSPIYLHQIVAPQIEAAASLDRRSMKSMPYQKVRSLFADRLMYDRAVSGCPTSGEWNKCLEKHGAAPLTDDMELVRGDLSLMTDAKELFPYLKEVPGKCLYTGPIFNSEVIPIPEDLEQILKAKSDRKKVLVSVGSAGSRDFLLSALRALNALNCEVFASVIWALSEEDLKEFPPNFHFRQKYPLVEMAEYCDAAIILGGQGTVYAMIAGDCPFLSLPHSFEQRHNVDNIVSQFGCGRVLYPYELTQANISREIAEVLVNPAYAEGMHRLHEIIKPYYTCAERRAEVTAANIIEWIGSDVEGAS